MRKFSGGAFAPGDTRAPAEDNGPAFLDYTRWRYFDRNPTPGGVRAAKAWKLRKWKLSRLVNWRFWRIRTSHSIFSVIPKQSKHQVISGRNLWRIGVCRMLGHEFMEDPIDEKFEYRCGRCQGWFWGKR